MNKTILIIEDDSKMRRLISDYCRKEGYSCLEAEDGEKALTLFRGHKVDLVILDVMLPRLDGWRVCQVLRQVSDVPVIMLTARGEEEDKLHGFEMGADEYVTKPFSPRVLMAQIKAMLRRTESLVTADTAVTIALDGLVIDQMAHEVHVDGQVVGLTPKEYDLLLYLAKNYGIALSREQILDTVWGHDYFGDLRTVDTHIKRLREKLGTRALMISTVRGFGYKLEVKRP